MKMAEAFTALPANVEVLTQRHTLFALMPAFDYASFYGLEHNVKVHHMNRWRLPLKRMHAHSYDETFNHLALAHARKQQPDLIYTRSKRIAHLTSSEGLPTLLETHNSRANPSFAYIQTAAQNPGLLGVVTTNEVLKNEIAQAGIPDSKIFVHPNGCDPRQFDNLPSRNQLRQKLDLQAPTVLYTGHFYGYKGAHIIPAIARSLPHMNFKIAGGWQQDIKAMQENLTREGIRNVELLGFLPASTLPVYMKAADLLLLPNQPEGEETYTTNPIKLFSYLASRTPVVASDIPAFTPWLTHREKAVLVDPHSVSSFAEAISDIVEDRLDSDRMTENAKELALHYTWQKRAQRILDFFNIMPAN
jgi:glycosyltransferase involved in cell wall biosynthesis